MTMHNTLIYKKIYAISRLHIKITPNYSQNVSFANSLNLFNLSNFNPLCKIYINFSHSLIIDNA